MKIRSEQFGKTEQGETVQLFTLENNRGLTVKITNYGAAVTSILFPDKSGNTADIVLGFDNLPQYLGTHPYFGAICGRFANRIANATFSIDDRTYKLAANDGANSLHGGLKGFDKVLWHGTAFQTSEEVGVKLTYLSKDMEEGFPGNLLVEVVYTVNNLNELNISYLAESDAPTVVNLTNHTYFNLNGCKDTVLNHIMQINADRYTEVNNQIIPTGRTLSVEGTAFDFRKGKKIGQDIADVEGYDHNFILNKASEDELSFAGVVYDPDSGRILETYTSEPGLQFYSANYLDGTIQGKDGIVYKKHFGFCLEAQHFPDSPNQPNFPTTELYPGEQYSQLTIYRFGIRE
ncbi:MAG: galactose mutarotase [Fibrobacter sp.]|nr:galactose mutarotase [Fibrobacter sp.]